MSETKENVSQIVSRERVQQHGEVFTSEREVKAMCDLVKSETERIESRFLEPACGQGAFLLEILDRKLAVVSQRYKTTQNEWERFAIVAVSSLYGIDIQQDNVELCRQNLLRLFSQHYTALFPHSSKQAYLSGVAFVLSRNIIWGDALTLATPDMAKKPLIFSEWSDIGNGHIKRRDFTLRHLMENHPYEEPNLFSDLGDQVFLPKPIADYPPIHFLKLCADE